MTSLIHVKRIFHAFAQIDPKMQLSTAMVLLEIANADANDREITNKEIEKALGLRSGTTTRNIYYWTEEGHPENSGAAGLVSVTLSLQDRRQRVIKLTPKGRSFI